MTQSPELRLTPGEMPRVRQKVLLVCRSCGRQQTHDVGTIYVWDREGEGTSSQLEYGFSKYFRCDNCGGAGPWDMANGLQVMGLKLRVMLDPSDARVVKCRPALLDGTSHQTPAMGEEYLRRLIEKAPNDAFLHTRLGNLLRGCHRWTDAAGWYAKALTLDPGDLEARYHLFWFAADDVDVSTAIEHSQSLVRHLLAGRKTNSDELTRKIARSVVEMLRDAPAKFCAEFLRRSEPLAEPPERRFIRTLLEEEGDEEGIVTNATDRLLHGDAGPAPPQLTAILATLENDDTAGPPFDLIPSLRALVEQERLDARKLTVAVATGDDGHLRVTNRHAVFLFDGKNGAAWDVPSLRDLFRGDKSPPPDMDKYPDAYARCFFCIEKHVLSLCDVEGNRTDQEMEPVYSALRRRPDGRNHLGAIHDFVWQAAALMLGMHRLSAAEFEAIVGALERSVRRWALRPVSRNYVRFLRDRSG
jgi:hypothetical protein